MSTDLATQIQETIKNHPIMVFMKGTPETPQCGFSARVVDILNQYGKPYASANILLDPAIREEVSKQSNWPTIPQVFINGEFVGGCDILQEMHGRGEIQPLLDAAFTEVAEVEGEQAASN